MKKVWKIIWRLLLGVGLTVYLAVALLNYSVVQSYLGALAGNYISKEWNCTLRIGSLHATPLDHLIANDILFVSPTGDTIFDGKTLRVSFRHFPYKKGNLEEGGLNVGTLALDRVYIGNAYYHFESIAAKDSGSRATTNLQFIIDYFNPEHTHSQPKGQTFTVDVGTVILNHVHYKMDLPDKRTVVYDYGVEIPHMEFYDVKARIKDVHVVNDDVTARLVKLSTEERSGFKADNISAKVHVSNREIRVRDLDVSTPRSHIMLDALLSYDGWAVMDDYLRTVYHDVTIHDGTTVAMSDAAYWAPVLWGIDVQLKAYGEAHGTIDSMATSGLHVGYGHATTLDLDGSIAGLTDITTTELSLDNLTLRAERSDLERLSAGLGSMLPHSALHYMQKAEYVDLVVGGHGGISSPSALNVDLACGLGNLHADATATPVTNIRDYNTDTLQESYLKGWHVELDGGSDGLDLTLLGLGDWLTYSGLALSLAADIPEKPELKNIPAEVDATLMRTVVRGNRLDRFDLHAFMEDGLADIELLCDDSLLRINIDCLADIGDSIGKYQAKIDLRHMDMQAFQLMTDKYKSLQTGLDVRLEGSEPENITAEVRATDTRLGATRVDNMQLKVESRGNRKLITLDSDPLDATINGSFAYAHLPLMVRHMLQQVLPADLGLTTPIDSLQFESIANNTMNFNMQWNDDGRLLHSIDEDVTVAKGTRLGGSYNTAELLKLALRSDSLRLGSLLLDNLGLSSRSAGANYIVDLEAQEVNVGKTELLKRLNISLGSNASHSILQLVWGDDNDITRGDVMLRLADGNISVQRPNIYIGDSTWTLAIDSLKVEHPAGDIFAFSGSGISLSSGSQRIVAGLALRQRDDDNLKLDFNQFNLGGLCKVILQGSNVDVDGRVGGHFEMYGFGEKPYFNAALTVDSCIVNHQSLGDVNVRSTWNAELNTVNLNLSSDHLDATGWLQLGNKDVGLNFAARFDSFELALAAPFLSTFSSRFEGQLHGNFDITGTLSHPVILGGAIVENGAIKIDMTDVTYHFNDSIHFTNNNIVLRQFALRDPYGNIAAVDGTIRYSSLDDIMLDLRLATENILLLNQKKSDQFRGTLLASATAHLHGSANNPKIDVSARTNRGCDLTVPISNMRTVKAQNYITFVGEEEETQQDKQGKPKKSNTPFSLSLDLGITPDLHLNLPMDFSEVTATVAATGSGDLHIDLDQEMSPQVGGSYEIIDGTLKLNMLSLLEKNFSIENGSNLLFQGPATDARFDLRAVYSQRVNLSTLTGNLSATSGTQKYIQVEDIIAIAGTLAEPSIKFDLRLPNSDQSVEEEVFAYIDRNSERDMINQTVSLLLLGQFYNVSGTEQDAGSTASSAASGGIGTIASTIGSFMADMVDFVDINVDYKAANQLTNEQLDFNISKDWGRWYLESTLGYGGESRELEASSTGGTVLDALIGYRITPLIHLFAYNRTNTNDYTRLDLPYKQGVGLKLTKDFDNWSQLFGSQKKHKKKKK